VSRLFIRPSTIKWELAVLRGLGDKKVAVILKAAVFSAFILPKMVIAFIT